MKVSKAQIRANKKWAKKNPEKMAEYRRRGAIKIKSKNKLRESIYNDFYRLQNKEELRRYIINWNKQNPKYVKEQRNGNLIKTYYSKTKKHGENYEV